jgi:hypothetical protein
VGPCHHGMAHPHVVNEGMDGAVNILNKQSRTAKKGGPPAWGKGEVLTTPHHKNLSCYEMFTHF